jgi:hypothetical protein
MRRLINKIKVGKSEGDKAKPLFIYESVERLIDECIPPQYAHEYIKLLDTYSGSLSEKKKKEFVKKKRMFEK